MIRDDSLHYEIGSAKAAPPSPSAEEQLGVAESRYAHGMACQSNGNASSGWIYAQQGWRNVTTLANEIGSLRSELAALKAGDRERLAAAMKRHLPRMGRENIDVTEFDLPVHVVDNGPTRWVNAGKLLDYLFPPQEQTP